jgi:3-isopropylmalate/(R)-2-methylmalate dehydratase small subunit
MIGGGRAWVLGDDIDTDLLAPGAYMKGSLATLAGHCLEAVAPRFAREVRPGDVVVAGRNFGIGSSREQAAEALKHLGIAAVIAESFGGIFYRNALNLGLSVLVSSGGRAIAAGDQVSVDARAGIVRNDTTGQHIACEPLPDFLLRVLEDGGLMPHLERRFRREKRA